MTFQRSNLVLTVLAEMCVAVEVRLCHNQRIREFVRSLTKVAVAPAAVAQAVHGCTGYVIRLTEPTLEPVHHGSQR
jgi:hypothetical protein